MSVEFVNFMEMTGKMSRDSESKSSSNESKTICIKKH